MKLDDGVGLAAVLIVQGKSLARGSVGCFQSGEVRQRMSQRNIEKMAADGLWEQWRADIERIRGEVHELFSDRRTFRDVREVFAANPRLQTIGSHFWEWLRVNFAWSMIMRIRREADEQPNTVNLNRLLREIETRPDVITRGRMRGMWKADGWLLEVLDETFSSKWLADPTCDPSDDDRVDPNRVAEHRTFLVDAMTRACEVANQALAHRTRKESKALTTPEADDAFQAIEDCLKDYYALLHGVSLSSAEPTAQFDTLEVFTFPWIERSTEDQ